MADVKRGRGSAQAMVDGFTQSQMDTCFPCPFRDRERIICGTAVRVLLLYAARSDVKARGVSALSGPLSALEIMKTVPTLNQLCESSLPLTQLSGCCIP